MPRPAKLDLSLVPKVDAKEDARGAFSGIDAEYSLGPVLGAGTTAVVKRALRRADGKQVAVKCIRSRDEEVREFAQQEYEVLRSLRHHSIIRVEALQPSGSSLFMVMELCEGGCLASRVRKCGTLSEGKALVLVRQLLEAVSYLHQKRIVHRDLKPDNILLKGDGNELKLTDFNSAKVIGNSSVSTAMLTHRGTRAYLAPEVLLGHDWNERVDIWASGLCLYFMICGKLPFDSESPRVKSIFAAGRLPTMAWRDDGPSSELQALVRECLAVAVSDRPPAMKLLVHPLFMMEAKKEPEENSFLAGFNAHDVLQLLASELCCAARAGAVKTTQDELVQRYSDISWKTRKLRSRARSMPLFATFEGACDCVGVANPRSRNMSGPLPGQWLGISVN